MLTILFLILFIAKNFREIRKTISRRRIKPILSNELADPHARRTKTMRYNLESVSEQTYMSQPFTAAIIALLNDMQSGVIDEAEFRQAISRLLATPALNEIKKSA